MLFVRDVYCAIVRVVIFQSCRAFVTDFLKGHRLASSKAAHQVHTTEQTDAHAVHTNPRSACCGRGLPDQVFDAYAALRYLSQLDFVELARVAVFGQSMGGETALHAVNRDSAAQFFPERFSAAIAYYPYCDVSVAPMTAPTLILIGEADEGNPAEQCRQMVAHAPPDSVPIALTVYPGVHHNFDVALLTPGVRYRGFWLEYNEPAAKDAEEKTRAFLGAHLVETTPGEPTAK